MSQSSRIADPHASDKTTMFSLRRIYSTQKPKVVKLGKLNKDNDDIHSDT